MDISLLLTMVAETAPDRVATGTGDRRLTYSDLDAAANRLATHLTGSAEPVAFLAENSPIFPVVMFGAARSERPMVPLNYRLPDEQLGRLLDRLGEPTIVVAADMVHRIPDQHRERIVLADDAWAIATDADRADAGPFFIDPDAEAVLLFTSGTTGEPKAVVLRHEKLTNYVLGSVEFLGADEDEAAIVVVPPYHIAGVTGVLSTVYNGRRTIQLASFDPATWVQTVRDENVTHAMVVPTMLKRILDHIVATGDDVGNLRHLSYGGGPMPAAVIEQAVSVLGDVNLTNAYGLTETSATVAVLTPDDHREAVASSDPRVRARLGSVGRPIPSVEVEVRDGNGAPLAAGEAGLLFVRGPQVSGEYRGMSALDADGWFNTRDRAYLDDDGFLFLAGREDDVIVRGGENTSPGEIEDVLQRHAAVADAAVFGMPDDEWGQRIEAAVVTHADVDPEELRSWVRAELRSTKVPSLIHLRESLPYNEMGKLLRRQLQHEYVDLRVDGKVNP